MSETSNRSVYKGDILSIREVEDCIRATKKYTKGVFRKQVKHPEQGEDFPSRVITEYYEVYPDIEVEVGWSMPASMAFAWIFGDTPHIDVWFHYDYRNTEARLEIDGGEKAVAKLMKGIPNLESLLSGLRTRYEKKGQVVDSCNRVRSGSVANPQ